MLVEFIAYALLFYVFLLSLNILFIVIDNIILPYIGKILYPGDDEFESTIENYTEYFLDLRSDPLKILSLEDFTANFNSCLVSCLIYFKLDYLRMLLEYKRMRTERIKTLTNQLGHLESLRLPEHIYSTLMDIYDEELAFWEIKYPKTTKFLRKINNEGY